MVLYLVPFLPLSISVCDDESKGFKKSFHVGDHRGDPGNKRRSLRGFLRFGVSIDAHCSVVSRSQNRRVHSSVILLDRLVRKKETKGFGRPLVPISVSSRIDKVCFGVCLDFC